MKNENLPNGVMLNAYPDSIGETLADIVSMLKRPEFADVFSLFYILPTFFNSDLDRGFSIIDYDINKELVTSMDLARLEELGIKLKFDLVLNHLSVASRQFKDMLKKGDESKYRRFFIDWNEFWALYGDMGPDGYVVPKKEFLDRLFMRKPGLPILKVRFPDGSDRPYWNTFYQKVDYLEIAAADLLGIEGIWLGKAQQIAALVNKGIRAKKDLVNIDFGEFSGHKDAVISIVEQKRIYLGQMDLNAQFEGVWDFYDETLKKLRDYGATMVRLDAFAYLHKQPGMVNFFNKPGTWDYLARLKRIAEKYDLILLPEIHSEYGNLLHEEVSGEGFPIYDFFLPGLVIDALDRCTSQPLRRWIGEIMEKKIMTVNMLGCHDGIPILDLKGGDIPGFLRKGLLEDAEIEAVMERVMERGGRVKNLFGADGKKISYYQVNATYFSALGEDEQKLRLARAIQLFMPGIPQVWYLDIFAGKNNYEAADRGGAAGHKEINRTELTKSDVEQALKKKVVLDQLELMRLRNTSPAFCGELEVADTDVHLLQMTWKNNGCEATLKANLRDYSFTIARRDETGEKSPLSYG
ncbi:MAG: glycosidase [Chromatiaceae bacterium]|nr:glycosidase [Chromatiaceae bacterium]